jgi:phospholipase D
VILDALAEAHGRGVDVQVILDKSEERDHGSRPAGAQFAAEAGIPTWIDDKVAIAHNKVIIIDGHLVIGGSYNYTASAERKNAENVTFINAPVVADFYLVNWDARKAVSRPSRFEAGPAGGPDVVASSRQR